MDAFNDKYLYHLDPKFRLRLPMEIRQQFEIKKGDQLHLIPYLSEHEHLEIRTESQWQLYKKKFLAQASNEHKKDFLRYAEVFQEYATVDGQGRIVITERIRDLCKLDETVAVINMHTYAEVWEKTNMERKYPDLLRAYKEFSDRLY